LNPLKRLASQTAIYGIPSIVGRVINFLLIPIITSVIGPAELAPYIELYAYAGILLVFLSYGMETAFFKFVQNSDNPKKVLSTALISIVSTSFFFILIVSIGRHHIAEWIGYVNHPEYIVWFAIILGVDVISNLLFAWLRYLEKPTVFALVKSTGVLVNVALTFYWIYICHNRAEAGKSIWLYDNEIGIGYVFIANLIASCLLLVLLLPYLRLLKEGFDKTLFKKMLVYSAPLILVGIGGILNEMLDRVALRHLLSSGNIDFEIGVYGAFYKLSIIMTIFIQAFRYAAEPFFFAQHKDGERTKIYADVMFYFVLVCSFIFLITSLFAEPLARQFIRQDAFFNHRHALTIVPILLMANLFLGVNYNLNIWYKLKSKTMTGAKISLFGAALTVVFLFTFTPKYGFIACAWTTLGVYMVTALISYFIGQKHFKVPYTFHGLILILLSVLGLYVQHLLLGRWNISLYLANFIVLGVFSVIAYLLMSHYKKL
jgi:O-antigen/teichoic acid export membrane protein